MVDSIYFAGMAIIVIIFIAVIITEKRRENKRKNRIVYLLERREDFRLACAMLWAVLFVVWTGIFIRQAGRVYRYLGREYFDNVFQLLNPEHLEALRSYFFENEMIMELSRVRFYQIWLPKTMFWIVASGCLSIVWFYRSRQRDTVYEDGVMAGGRLYKWDRVEAYNWGKRYVKKRSDKELWYNELILTIKQGRTAAKVFRQKAAEVTLEVEDGGKRAVDSCLNDIIDGETLKQGDRHLV